MITNKDLSIVIPCKNEGMNIIRTLDIINSQINIENINIIISDSSDDKITIPLILKSIDEYQDKLNIKIIEGGYPSDARAKGSKYVDSEYIIFLDADVILIGTNFLSEAIIYIKNNELDLLTVKFITNKEYNYIYYFFNLFQRIGLLLNSVFAVGGFQLWNKKSYDKTGGYLPELLFSEDYWLSSKVNKSKFKIHKKLLAYTSPRRFKSKGVYYMFKMMILSYLNRNNIEFFKKHHNYWK